MSRNSVNEIFQASSFLQGANSVYVEQMYERFARDPLSVDPSWQEFFSQLGDAPDHVVTEAAGAPWSRQDWPPKKNDEMVAAFDGQWQDIPSPKAIKEKLQSKAVSENGAAMGQAELRQAVLDSIRALMLIRAYRIRGHLVANLDPLGMQEREEHPELDPQTYGFTAADMDRHIFIDHVLGLENAPLRQILDILKRTYCGTFALQFMHISDPVQVSWLKERIEGYNKEIHFTREGRKAILNKLIEAEGFEKFLHVKYMGTKRFGIDGGEALIPALEQIIKRGGALGAREIVFGMPHRGRLNVLANVMAKPYQAIFHEFQGGSFKPEDVGGSGDVKYHLGASSDRSFDDNQVHLSLTANPSHLEAVNPVVLGKARAKQWQLGDNVDRTTVIPVLLHGDAAFAGQGIVQECLGLSGLRGHRTGGAIHFIVNNQIGFTTAPHFSRSSPYPSDVALMVDAPIFHVNGDDPEAVVHAAKVATEFRQLFKKDVVIDMFCYRRFGHNEGDEPMFTQPRMYKNIKKKKTTLQLYGERLIEEGLIDSSEFDEARTNFQEQLSQEFDAATEFRPNKADWLDGRWSGLEERSEHYQRGDTGVELETLKQIGKAIVTVPEGFSLHKTVGRLLKQKQEMFDTGKGIDWATGEALAYGSLLKEGYAVRLAGQDSVRGTFSQRHAAYNDQETDERYFPLRELSDKPLGFEVIDSMLSEYAVLGFEYGYSLTEPNALVMWEAQFGDFVNGAQIMIDQFICSGELKWLRMSGLVMLLPHGFEGQGPEHSSARIERFLQNSAEENWVVANCTTPANYFHILRRQLHRSFRKPLILFTPKSLLRHKKCVSSFDEMGPGSSFHRILRDDAERLPDAPMKLAAEKDIKRVVICSGKVYYDLLEERDKRGASDVYLLRLEQYYPFPSFSLKEEVKRFPNADIVWCQEEPKNQGAWFFVEPEIEAVLTEMGHKVTRARYAGRAAAASPATGLASRHRHEQEALINDALSI
ncbi:MAG: 2-oxoglutarate dehydrogenase E1 component [Neomegalonema sp.]|nr:2-oxoglutarate dehydrogenase E1 component [Neomegalonema sp.]